MHACFSRTLVQDYLKEVEDEMHGQEAGTKSAEDTALVAHEQGELPRRWALRRAIDNSDGWFSRPYSIAVAS